MDRFNSKKLMESSKRITRFNMKQFKSIFPFLELPAELRNKVYEYATTDPQRLADFFDKYYERLLAARAKPLPWVWHDENNSRMLAPPTKKAPNVFLINKQMYHEASYIFYHVRSVSFHHGMLELRSVYEFISPHILKNISAINITDSGHNEIIQLDNPGKTISLPCSWNGYMRLISQLGRGLSRGGHKLKEFTIDFSNDERLEEHLVRCQNSSHVCGFRDQARTALDTLRGIRGVGRVTLKGLNPEYAANLKARMESKAVVFADLPKSVRNIVYREALGFANISDAIMRAVDGRPQMRNKSFPYPLLTTPTVLLMNKKFSAEAMEVLDDCKHVLKFDLPAAHHIRPAEMPKLSRFVGRETLKSVRSVNINMQSRDWLESLDCHLISAFTSRSSKLVSFELTFLDDKIGHQWPQYPDAYLLDHLIGLRSIRDLDSVKISGTLPLCFTDPLASAMTTPYRSRLPKLRAKCRGKIVELRHEIDYDHHVAK